MRGAASSSTPSSTRWWTRPCSRPPRSTARVPCTTSAGTPSPPNSPTLANLVEGTSLCALGYLMNSWQGAAWAGRDPERHDLCAFTPDTTQTTVGYLISRDYAATVIDRWDIPARRFRGRPTSELIVQWS